MNCMAEKDLKKNQKFLYKIYAPGDITSSRILLVTGSSLAERAQLAPLLYAP